jgi:hypothetical protein
LSRGFGYYFGMSFAPPLPTVAPRWHERAPDSNERNGYPPYTGPRTFSERELMEHASAYGREVSEACADLVEHFPELPDDARRHLAAQIRKMFE